MSTLLLYCIFIHEIWICLQHGNILFNPLCQRLDRNYGIALLKNGMAWVISLTLGAYWSREILSMMMCIEEVKPTTKYLIFISIGYHSFKSVNIFYDAWRQWSPKLGIMHLLLDYWHWDSLCNCLISLKRIFLQAFDTYVHAAIIFDLMGNGLLMSERLSKSIFLITASVWFIHAAIVQINQKSTATVMVEIYKNVAIICGLVKAPTNSERESSSKSRIIEKHFHQKLNQLTKTWDKSAIMKKICGKHVFASPVRERDCQVCRLLAQPQPLPSGPTQSIGTKSVDVVFLVHPMQLTSALAYWTLPKNTTHNSTKAHKNVYNHHSVNAVATVSATVKYEYWKPQWWMHMYSGYTLFISIIWWPFSVLFTSLPAYVVAEQKDYKENRCEVWLNKSFAWQYLSHTFWKGYGRHTILKSAQQANVLGVKVVGLGALNKAYFINRGGEDIMKAVESRHPSWHTRIVHGNTLTAAVVCEVLSAYLSSRLTDNSLSNRQNYIYSSNNNTVILTGATSSVGRAVALTLCRQGIHVICILQPSRRSEAIVQESKSFCDFSGGGQLTICHSYVKAVVRYPGAVWVLGKSNPEVLAFIPSGSTVFSFAVPTAVDVSHYNSCRPKLLRGTSNFMNQPRDDLKVVDVGLMEVPLELRSSTSYNVMMLPGNLMYACHVGTIVHALEDWTHHEVGDVVLDAMNTTLIAARKHGFLVPLIPHRDITLHHNPLSATSATSSSAPTAAPTSTTRDGIVFTDSVSSDRLEEVLDVVIVGGGASGLATVAHLQHYSSHLTYLIIDSQPKPQGQWLSQYSDLQLTSRPAYSSLPFMDISSILTYFIPSHIDDTAATSCMIGDKNITAEDYATYLSFYSLRFGIARRTIFQSKVIEGIRQELNDGKSLWKITYVNMNHQSTSCTLTTSTLHAKYLVVATGNQAIPKFDSGLQTLLKTAGGGCYEGEVRHSSEIQCIEELAKCSVLLVGSGNSSLDLSVALLAHGASCVHMSWRSIPPVVPRQWMMLSVEAMSCMLLQYLPVEWADDIVWFFYRMLHGSSYTNKLPGRRRNPDWYPYSSERVPPIDKGEFVAGVAAGKILVHPEIIHAQGRTVFFKNETNEMNTNSSSSSFTCDVIVFCTGYKSSFDWLHYFPTTLPVEALPPTIINQNEKTVLTTPLSMKASMSFYRPSVVNQDKDGLFFVGYHPGSALLPLLAINQQAKDAAEKINILLKHSKQVSS